MLIGRRIKGNLDGCYWLRCGLQSNRMGRDRVIVGIVVLIHPSFVLFLYEEDGASVIRRGCKEGGVGRMMEFVTSRSCFSMRRVAHHSGPGPRMRILLQRLHRRRGVAACQGQRLGKLAFVR